MKASLLAHLVCPQCGEPLHIDRGELVCRPGQHRYMITLGVPVLLPADLTEDQKQVADTYSRKWDTIPNYGYGDSALEFQRAWYLQKFGWETVDNFRKFLWEQERILDAGCGLGRDVEFYAQNAAGEIFGVDISDSILTAQEKLGYLPNVHLIKADITRLPFPDNYFDFVACDQALHHTPNTRNSFLGLLRHVKPGGQIAVYVYGRKGVAREIADDLMRKYTTEMSHDDCVIFSTACAMFGQTVSRLDLEMQRDIYWNIFKCFWSEGYDFTTNVLINLDWYQPKYAWRHTPEEVKEWCKEANLTVEHFDICNSGISIRGYKAK